MEWKIVVKNIARKVEWNRSGKGMEQERKINFKFTGVNISWNGIEMEWKWNGTFTTKKVNAKQNGNGTEIEW